MKNLISFLKLEWKVGGPQLRKYSCLKFISFLVIFIISGEFHPALGGNCWLTINQNGKCTSLVKSGISREDCCGSGSVTASWGEGELMTPSSIFYMHIQGGVPCARCKLTCDGVQCPEGRICVMRNDIPKCVCSPNCSSFKIPQGMQNYQGFVCGTDGRGYKSPCKLMKRACRKKEMNLAISYYGPCRMTCEEVTCPSKKRCILDQNERPHCVNCNHRKCTDSGKRPSREFCGVNEVTYPSMCLLRQAACNLGKAIPVAYRGRCKKLATCANVKCLGSQTCLREVNSGKPRCVTCSSLPEWCKVTTNQFQAPLGPICSTNGKTYKNWCEMKEEACSTGTALDTEYFGECRRNSGNGSQVHESNRQDMENESSGVKDI